MIHSKSFWERPLGCLLGFHQFRKHPGGIPWRVCYRCWGERKMR